jgi:3-methyladenine DNA glycosylase AlkC
LPHVSFVALYGLNAAENGDRDPFEISMRAQYEFTRRFSSEFSMRPFLIRYPERTLARLLEWTRDSDYHVRRLCSEGARPVMPLLEALKDDPELYVRRSVANHLGDIAKDHPEIVFKLCKSWLIGAST